MFFLVLNEDAAKRKKEMNDQKSALIEALEKRLTALLDLEESSGGEEGETKGEGATGEDEVGTTFAELRKWVDTTEVAYAQLHARHEARAGR